VLFLSMYCLLLTIRVFCFLKNLHLIWLYVILSQSNREAGYNLCKMQYLILACMWSEFTIWQEVFLQSLKVTQKLWQEFFRDPSQCWDHRSEKVSEHQTCLSSHINEAIPLVGVNLFSLCGFLLSFPRLN